MAILVVDDESNTREALRELLVEIGHKPVLEAKNGEEALKTLGTEKSKIAMIIADWEMPYMDGITLLDRIADIRKLDLCPFLLITSDLTKGKLRQVQQEHSRLDAFLIKPFRIGDLKNAMSEAYHGRWKARGTAVVLAHVPEGVRPIQSENWKELCYAEDFDSFSALLEEKSRTLGAVIVDPCVFGVGSSSLGEWSGRFRKSPVGASVPIACLSREPEAIFPVRTHADYFFNPPSVKKEWESLFWGLKLHALHAWDLNLLSSQAKEKMQAGDSKGASKLAHQMMELGSRSPQLLSLLGDIESACGNEIKAWELYRQALAGNPCLTKPYLRLLDEKNTDASESVAENAAQYCPQNVDVLLRAAQFWLAKSMTAKAKLLLERILAINPSQKDALEAMKKT